MYVCNLITLLYTQNYNIVHQLYVDKKIQNWHQSGILLSVYGKRVWENGSSLDSSL